MLASISEKSRESERFVLPPIRTLDKYVTKKQPYDQNNHSSSRFTMLSPPNSYTSSVTSPSSSSSGHSPIMIQRPPSPPRTAFEKTDSPIYPVNVQETSVSNKISNNSTSTSTSTNANANTNTNTNNNTLHTISSDVDQVVRQANNLCNNMVHYKPYLLSTNTSSNHEEELRPWMDDMIGKANQVLNALLRLRKHQMVSSPTAHAMTGSTDHPTTTSSFTLPPTTSTFSSIPSPPSSSSTQMTLTKRDWSNNTPSQHSYSYHHHRQPSYEMASIPSRQRKRGKRANFQGRCHSCNISETPEWRRGPDGARTLCNACGLHYAKLARKKAASSTTTSQKNQMSSR